MRVNMSNKEGYKKCSKCGKELPYTSEYFYKDKSSKSGLAYSCKNCHKEKIYSIRGTKEYSEKNRKYVMNHHQKYREEERKWVKNYRKTEQGKMNDSKHGHIRRARIANLPNNLSTTEWIECKKYFNNKCAYCGKGLSLEKDHFIALSKGGEFTINNVIPACKSCNNSKHDRDFFIWYPKFKYYSKIREKKILKYLKYNPNRIQQLHLSIE
ncbi:HNH endonuclease [Clostridium botulinum]|nr:HNH endonuclease [Clostridium botulinum]